MKKLFVPVVLFASLAFIACHSSSTGDFSKDKLTHTWQLDSLGIPVDNSTNSLAQGILNIVKPDLRNVQWKFNDDGTLLQTVQQESSDSGTWKWQKPYLVIDDNGTEKPDSFFLQNLTKDSLILRSADSSRFYFIRVK